MRAMELKFEGRKPVGRQKRTWSKVVEEDMRKVQISQKIWESIDNSGGDSYHVQSQEWENRDSKRR